MYEGEQLGHWIVGEEEEVSQLMGTGGSTFAPKKGVRLVSRKTFLTNSRSYSKDIELGEVRQGDFLERKK